MSNRSSRSEVEDRKGDTETDGTQGRLSRKAHTPHDSAARLTTQ